jgi:thioredoxin 1
MSNRVTPIVLTDATFAAAVLNSAIPVLVDFWAPWCGPCRAIAPTITELATEFAGRVKVAKLNVDEQVNTASRLNIRAIPTLAIFKEGELVERVEGLVSKPQLMEKLNQLADRSPVTA